YYMSIYQLFFFFSSRRRHTRFSRDWSSDVCSSDLPDGGAYLHVTGQVQVWRAPEPFVYPANQTMNRATNQRLLIAEREYAISFDCMNGRALFDPLGGVS